MLGRRLVGLLIATFWAFIGCLQADGSAPFEDAVPSWQGEQPSSWIEISDEPPRRAVEPEPMDVEICEAQAAAHERCAAESDAAMDVQACAERFACSRQLWRTDVPAVYDCLRQRACDDPDPVMACLRKVAVDVEPSAAELSFEQELAEARRQCGELVEVAPRQSDAVYDALTFCLAAHDDCEVKVACIEAMLQALVEEICGTP